jgi:Metallo-beta-lactamase superfamily
MTFPLNTDCGEYIWGVLITQAWHNFHNFLQLAQIFPSMAPHLEGKVMWRIVVLLTGIMVGIVPSFAQTESASAIMAGKRLLAQEHPEVLRAMARYDGFGGPSSALIANRMQDHAPELVVEAQSKMSVEPQGKGLWLIRFPYVNVVLVETKDSLVLLDTGYAAIGPVLRDLIPTLSAKPLKTIVITHTHVDHV